MVISGITYYPYELKLKIPFMNAKGTIDTRSGYIIEIRDAAGNAGIGEAAPLPEYGSESIDKCRNAILRFVTEYPEEINELTEIVNSLRDYYSTPAARHGLEQALLNLYSAVKNESIPKLLNMESNPVVRLNSLIGLVSPAEAAKTARAMVNKGYETIKIKIGRPEFQDDLDVVMAIRDEIGYYIDLRMDVNAGWEYEKAVTNLKALRRYKPEYIEQPCPGKEDLIRLAFDSDIKIGADESVHSLYELNKYITNRYAQVLVIKPMILGSIIETAQAIKKAGDHNIKTIISSSFESSVAFRSNVMLASFTKEEYAHGLSTWDIFKADLYENPFIIAQAKINIPDPFLYSRI